MGTRVISDGTFFAEYPWLFHAVVPLVMTQVHGLFGNMLTGVLVSLPSCSCRLVLTDTFK